MDAARVLGTCGAGEWHVALISNDHRWAWSRPRTLQLAMGEDRLLEEELRLVEGGMQLVDAASGAPLAARSVRWDVGLPEADSWRKDQLVPLRSNAEGRCELRFPPGELELSIEGYAPQQISWPAAAESTLRFEPEG